MKDETVKLFLLIGLNNLLDGPDCFAIGIDQSVRWTSELTRLISLLDGPVG